MSKPKLVLHICCAPDEAWVVHSLHESYDLHCFFCNPNISPVQEYEIRLLEAKRVADLYSVPFSADQYVPGLWDSAIEEHRETPEGGARCLHCFRLRLGRTAAFCKALGWPSFTSVMSVSPHKNIAMLNQTGAEAAAIHGVKYEPFNFKKNNGFLKSIQLSHELGIYRQDYCGCSLSKTERDIRQSKTNNLAE